MDFLLTKLSYMITYSYEIRAKGKEGIGRSLFCTIKGQEIIILHSFIKKSKKTPKKEIDLARKRMKEVKQP